jgi:NADP-dependent 3-hydroxy acid dehydrogenase YdfG
VAAGFRSDNNMLTRNKCLNPEDVSNAILYLLSTPAHVQVGSQLKTIFGIWYKEN